MSLHTYDKVCRYRIRYRTFNVRYRMLDIRYRIQCWQKHRYRRFFLPFLPIYDIVRLTYDILYDIDKNIGVVRFLLFLPIVYTIQCTIPYVISRCLWKSYTICKWNIGNIRYRMATSYSTLVLCTSISPKTYDVTVRCDPMMLLAWGCANGAGVCGGSHWSCPWSAHTNRSLACLMILGPAGWSVLHRHSPDALSLSLAYYAATHVSATEW
jgi:hypothetical protein